MSKQEDFDIYYKWAQSALLPIGEKGMDKKQELRNYTHLGVVMQHITIKVPLTHTTLHPLPLRPPTNVLYVEQQHGLECFTFLIPQQFANDYNQSLQ